jgi:2-haloacid dehalogenase
MSFSSIIFDLGGVLIDWNPDYLFNKLFTDPQQKAHFLENICTGDWNEEQDAGRSLQEGTQELVRRHPEWKPYIEAYYGRWEEMLGGAFEETVEILRQLKESGRYKLYALTNWSAETFPIALQRYDFLNWFDGRLVSGEEKMRKPFPEFYRLMIDRFELNLQETLFIDDNARNIHGAEQAGLVCIRFTTPADLRDQLVSLGVL